MSQGRAPSTQGLLLPALGSPSPVSAVAGYPSLHKDRARPCYSGEGDGRMHWGRGWLSTGPRLLGPLPTPATAAAGNWGAPGSRLVAWCPSVALLSWVIPTLVLSPEEPRSPHCPPRPYPFPVPRGARRPWLAVQGRGGGCAELLSG